MKVRVEAADVFYYPDVLVTCDPADRQPYYKERPSLVVEVLSDTTEGTDRREKFLAYELLESLREYALVHQSRREVELFRRETRESAWVRSTHAGEDEVSFRSVGVFLPLTEIYQGLNSP
jgi:Uma2 family endonuclease